MPNHQKNMKTFDLLTMKNKDGQTLRVRKDQVDGLKAKGFTLQKPAAKPAAEKPKPAGD